MSKAKTSKTKKKSRAKPSVKPPDEMKEIIDLVEKAEQKNEGEIVAPELEKERLQDEVDFTAAKTVVESDKKEVKGEPGTGVFADPGVVQFFDPEVLPEKFDPRDEGVRRKLQEMVIGAKQELQKQVVENAETDVEGTEVFAEDIAEPMSKRDRSKEYEEKRKIRNKELEEILEDIEEMLR